MNIEHYIDNLNNAKNKLEKKKAILDAMDNVADITNVRFQKAFFNHKQLINELRNSEPIKRRRRDKINKIWI